MKINWKLKVGIVTALCGMAGPVIADVDPSQHPSVKIKETQINETSDSVTTTTPDPVKKHKANKHKQTKTQNVSTTQTDADNTKVNQRDRNASEPTADQQKMDQTDTDITARIRKDLVQDNSLSTYAHNVKIISENGHVTLKGPVRSIDEKNVIEEKAHRVAGNNVLNELEIAP